MFFSSDGEKVKFLESHKNISKLTLTDRQLFDLELIISGGFAPLRGFLSQGDYESVLETMHLKNGSLWPMPIVLDVDETVSKTPIGDKLLLTDSYNNPIAVLTVESVYKPDKHIEALKVYGTTDETHPGVKYLFKETKDYYMGGVVSGIDFSPKYDFKEFRHHPHELKKLLEKKGVSKVVAFQTRNPMHRAHVEIVNRSQKQSGGHILLHPVVGLTKEGDIDYVTRVRSYKKLYETYLKDNATLSLLPLAMRMAGPREALWHALIRKNYGATHFIIGRDHAGPGNNKEGKPFYGPYDAQVLAKKYEKEIGLEIITQPEMVYVEELDMYVSPEEVSEGHTVKNISGTEFRRMLRAGEKIPSWFSYPEVIEELRIAEKRNQKGGVTIFFTGLSGSGKSTIANILKMKLIEHSNKTVTLLDGDVVRENLSKGLGFSKADRDTNIERIGFVASEITKHGGIALCSAIAPYKVSRTKNRDLIAKNGTYLEVYVSTPIDICEKRDVKGLYHKARQGVITGFTGVDDPYEIPEHPDFTFDTSLTEAEECADNIILFLKEKNLL
jgi:sulfate adenylyltransferase